MKKAFACLVATLACAMMAYAAAAATNNFTSSTFKFSMEYPEGWNMKEESSETEGSAEAAAMGITMPKMVSACFAEKKCKPGNNGKDPQLNLMITDLTSAAKMARSFKSPAVKASPVKTEAREMPDTCEVIEKGRKTWAGVKAPFETVRCPEKKRWRYTTTITMNRKRAKMNNMYQFECSMLSKSKDKADSLAEYQQGLKPHCEASIASSKMTK
jgi:hypothetical protein